MRKRKVPTNASIHGETVRDTSPLAWPLSLESTESWRPSRKTSSQLSSIKQSWPRSFYPTIIIEPVAFLLWCPVTIWDILSLFPEEIHILSFHLFMGISLAQTTAETQFLVRTSPLFDGESPTPPLTSVTESLWYFGVAPSRQLCFSLFFPHCPERTPERVQNHQTPSLCTLKEISK